jgi:hypothetical protein
MHTDPKSPGSGTATQPHPTTPHGARFPPNGDDQRLCCPSSTSLRQSARRTPHPPIHNQREIRKMSSIERPIEKRTTANPFLR